MSSTIPGPRPRRGWPLLLSNALDASGRQTADLAVDVLAVVVLGATAAQMGLLNALGTLAFLVLGIPIGVLVDRSPTVRLLLVSGLLRAGLLGTIVLAWAVGGLTLLHLYVVAALAGTAAVVVETTQTAIVPRIVGTAGVSGLVSRLQSAESVIGLVVPAGAGAAVALTGAGRTLAIGAALTALAALVLLRLRLDPAPAGSAPASTDPALGQSSPVDPAPGQSSSVDPAPGQSSWAGALARFVHEAREGWSTLRKRRTLWRLTLATMTVNLGLAVHSAVEVVLVLRTLDLGSASLGVLVSAGALGALVGSVVAVPLSRRISVRAALRCSMLLLAPVAALTLLALADRERALAWLLVGSFVWGLVIVAYNVLIAGLVAELTPVSVLGRVAATRRTLTMGIVPIGSVLGGLLADRAGIAWAVTVWVLLNAVGAAVALVALSSRGAPHRAD